MALCVVAAAVATGAGLYVASVMTRDGAPAEADTTRGIGVGLLLGPSLGPSFASSPLRSAAGAAGAEMEGAQPAPPRVGRDRRRIIPTQASGVFEIAPAAGPSSAAKAPGADMTYVVEVERGLPYGSGEVAARVDAVLRDPRGWRVAAGTTFARLADDEAASADVRVRLASPDTTDELCAPLLTGGEVSCRNGPLVVLNAVRWTEGVPHYRGDLSRYRQYLVNHEMGHAIGRGHVGCPAPGEPAPVMLQQTYGLQGCRINPWPTVS